MCDDYSDMYTFLWKKKKKKKIIIQILYGFVNNVYL